MFFLGTLLAYRSYAAGFGWSNSGWWFTALYSLFGTIFAVPGIFIWHFLAYRKNRRGLAIIVTLLSIVILGIIILWALIPIVGEFIVFPFFLFAYIGLLSIPVFILAKRTVHPRWKRSIAIVLGIVVIGLLVSSLFVQDFAAEAVFRRDPKLCQKADYNSQALCYRDVGIKRKDATVCNEIAETWDRIICQRDVLMNIGDLDGCLMLPDDKEYSLANRGFFADSYSPRRDCARRLFYKLPTPSQYSSDQERIQDWCNYFITYPFLATKLEAKYVGNPEDIIEADRQKFCPLVLLPGENSGESVQPIPLSQAGGPKISNVSLEQNYDPAMKSDAVSIRWSTVPEADAAVYWGPTSQYGSLSANGSFQSNHIGGAFLVESGKTYHYSIRSCTPAPQSACTSTPDTTYTAE